MLLPIWTRRDRVLRQFAGLFLLVAACDDSAADCIVPPCMLPLAIELTPTAAGSGAPLLEASFTVTGAVSGQGPCTQGKCVVLGGAGTYEVDVRAPGYQPAHARVVITGTTAACGCPTIDAQRLTVVLAVSG